MGQFTQFVRKKWGIGRAVRDVESGNAHIWLSIQQVPLWPFDCVVKPVSLAGGRIAAGLESSGFIGAVRLKPHRQGECVLSATGLVAARKRQKDHCMNCIQLALSNTAKADLLRSLLCRSTQLPVHCVESPCIEEACVVVVDPPHLRMMSSPLAFPERVVLITQNDANHLKDAWEAGVNSVVSEQDSPNTVVLAILSACLRSGSTSQRHVPARPSGGAPDSR
jgi:hypothetical protein